MPSLSFQTRGNAGNPAIMLVHGFMSCNAQWTLNAPTLARDYFVIMVELWGHGESPQPAHDSDCSMGAYIDQFERVRRHLDIERWALIGQSYGAGLVLGYAHRHAERCTAVIVTNSRSAFGNVRAVPNPRSKPRSPPDDPGFEPRKFPFHPIHSRRFPADIKKALVKSADNMTRRATALSAGLGLSLNSVHLLGDLPSPLLIANGTYEKSFQSDLQALSARYPDLNIAHLPGGHSVNIEAAQQFNDAVKTFLNEQLPRK